MRREDELILCCARSFADKHFSERICKLVSQDIDWHYIIHASSSHGVLSLVYQTLKRTCAAAVPHAILEEFQAGNQDNSIRSLLLTWILLDIYAL